MLIPAEIIVLDSSVRAACFPRALEVILPSDRFHGAQALALYNAQFNVWCCMKDGSLTVRDSREAELGTNPATRAFASPVHRWEVVHSVLFSNSFPTCIIAVNTLEEIWVGYSDGPIRVFEQHPPYRLKAELGVQTNKGAPNYLAASLDGCFVAAACGDDHVSVIRAPQKELVVRVLGHTNAVRAATFLGFSHIVATTGVDGVLCLWNLDLEETLDTPIAQVQITPGLCITSLLSVPVTGDDVRNMLSARPSSHLDALLPRVPNDSWVLLWVGCETGNIYVFTVPLYFDESDPSSNIANFFSQPFRELRRNTGVLSLALGPGVGAKSVMGTSSKSSKVFRYDATTFETLSALTASTVDGSVSVGTGAYPPIAVGPATVTPVWSVDTTGRLTQLTLERAGTVGAEADQRSAAHIQSVVLQHQVELLRTDLAAHQRLLDHIRNPAANPALDAATLDVEAVKKKIEHMHRSAIQILEHQVDNKIRVRYYRKWVLWHAHRKHLALRRACAILLSGNQNVQRRTSFHQWALGASIMKLRRIRSVAAVNLRTIVHRWLIGQRFATWRAFQGNRNAMKRLHHLLATTSTRRQQYAFDQWRRHAKAAMALKAKAGMLNCLLRQVASGLRAVYFTKWIQLRNVVAVKSSLRRTAQSCVGTLASSNERQFQRLYLRKWMNYPAIAVMNRRKINACRFLMSSCDSLIRRRMYGRWQTVARLRAARRNSAGANSTLMRLTESGIRLNYFRRWKSLVQLKSAATRGTATAGSAVAFIVSRSNRALTEQYYKKWISFATAHASVRRQRTSLDIFLRQTRLGRLLNAYHTWKKFSVVRRGQRQRDRTAQLLIRSSTEGLRRSYFTTWQRSLQHRKQSRRRDGVLNTFSRQSNASLLRIYFTKWHTMRLMVNHLNEVAIFMRNSGLQRLKKLRGLYYGKWMSFVTRRAIQRKREGMSKGVAQTHAMEDVSARIAALKERIDKAKHYMNTVIRDEEEAARRAEELESHTAEATIVEGQLDKKIATQHAVLERVDDQVNRYAFTLKSQRAHPVDLAAGWRNSWLDMMVRLKELSKRGATTPLTFTEYSTVLSQLRGSCIHLRNVISCDVADHLAVKRTPPEESKQVASLTVRRASSLPPKPATTNRGG